MAASAGDQRSASKTSGVSASDLLTCPVCLDNFKDPRTLHCLHTFCTSCLENCRQPYRRDLTCPVCKKVTHLSPHGIRGLQNDFRVQQIRELLCSGSPSAMHEDESMDRPGSPDRMCEICRSQQKTTAATNHCIQCCIYLCQDCLVIHQKNPVFTSHHVISLSSESTSTSIFCKVHKEYAVRYFCKQCNSMMCTICTMTHNPDHSPVSIDKHIITHHQQELQDALRMTKNKLADIKSKSKLLETLRQSYKKAMYEAQGAIEEKSKHLIDQIKEQEKTLLADVQRRVEGKMQAIGLDNLGELNFHKTNIETLHKDLKEVILGSPQQCLLAYEDLVSRVKTISDFQMPTLPSMKSQYAVHFVPSDDALQLVIGHIQELPMSPCSDEMPDMESLSCSPRSPMTRPPLSPNSERPTSPSATYAMTKRMSSIFNAISPGRKTELKMGRLKGVKNSEKPMMAAKSINADNLIESDNEQSGPTPSTSMVTCHSTASTAAQYHAKPKLICKIDQIGGWPGKITCPSSCDFLPDGSIIIAEGDNRLQVFDCTGQSSRIIGWGKIKPHDLVVMKNGDIGVTDKKDKCVKIFNAADGEIKRSWGAGMFGMPSGIAVMANGHFVVSDIERHMVSIHTDDGALLTQFGSWGSSDNCFNGPGYIAVYNEEIFVSDSGNGFIKIFDKTGKYLRKFSFSVASSNQGSVRRPQGLCLDAFGNVLVADRENHRVSAYKQENGEFLKHVLTRQDGIRYPCDIKVNQNGHAVIVESHSGFLSKEPHHAIRLFSIW